MPLPQPLLRVVLFVALMIVCASASNAAMDAVVSRYDTSVFSNFPQAQGWLDPRVSWHNKWKNGDRTQGDAFFLSSTALVPLTDGWHFFKACTIFFCTLALLAPFTLLVRLPWYAWVGVYCAIDLLRGLIFESFYAHLLIK